jgi:hypothetical protein
LKTSISELKAMEEISPSQLSWASNSKAPSPAHFCEKLPKAKDLLAESLD